MTGEARASQELLPTFVSVFPVHLEAGRGEGGAAALCRYTLRERPHGRHV